MTGQLDDIERLADEFESACRSAQQSTDPRALFPRIEQYLGRVTAESQTQLLLLLVPIEVEYREARGERVIPDEYQRLGAEAAIAAREALEGSTRRRPGPAAPEVLGSADRERSTPRSRVIGNYKLLQKIGDGGMGTVWMAEQERPVKRRVAIKLIKYGLGTEQVVARFEAERQALAMMDHPNIARVYDGGTTADGLPFLVMELVQGISFMEYCDKHRLTVRERLELFLPICSAIQHAHQKGIMHRDLKPSNVLVTLHDGQPMPKVIDFGLAKALQQHTRLSEKTMFTEFGQMVGTLQYMSPEQAEMNTLDIDTRSDVYSLGVMLYELLTGSTPLERESFAQHSFVRLVQLIREVEPPRPSARLSSISVEKIAGLSQQRKLEPRRLQRLLQGELDWIVMKALEKDRSRRYDSARSLRQDVLNFLEGDAVGARPPSSFYRLRKFVRKNRTLASAVIGMTLLSILFGVGSLLYARSLAAAERESELARSRAESERSRAIEIGVALEKERDNARDLLGEARSAKEEVERQKAEVDKSLRKAEKARGEAESERKVAESVRDFLQNNFLRNASVWDQANQFGPEHTPNAELTVTEMLDRASVEFDPDNIESRFPGNTRVQTEILDTISEALAVTGKFDGAIRFARASLSLQERHYGVGHAKSLAAKTGLCSTCILAGDLGQAGDLIIELVQAIHDKLTTEKRALEDARAGKASPPLLDGPESAVLCLDAMLAVFDRKTDPKRFVYPSLKGLNLLEFARLKFLRLIPLSLDVSRLLEERLGNEDRRVVLLQALVAMVYQATGQLDEALNQYERVYLKFEKLFEPTDTKLLAARLALAAAWHRKPEGLERAVSLNRESLKRLRQVLGPLHPGTVGVARVLAGQLDQAGALDEALQLSRETYQTLRVQRPRDRDTLALGNSMALILRKTGQAEQAEALFREVLSELGQAKPPSPEVIAIVQANLADLLLESGRAAEGLELARQADRDRRRGKETEWIRDVVGRAWLQNGEWETAAREFKSTAGAAAFCDRILVEAELLLRNQESDSAGPVADKLLEYVETRIAENPGFQPRQGQLSCFRGWRAYQLGEFETAKKLLMGAFELLTTPAVDQPPDAAAARRALAVRAAQLLGEIGRQQGVAEAEEKWSGLAEELSKLD